jgi:preprotein translocase subunit SecA
VVKDIVERHEKGQPVLVGTVSVEKSEYLSSLLKKRGISHSVLNAKQHRREAAVVAEAGRKGAVTVATNMAGRGTDIMLGGNAEFRAVQALAEQGLSPEESPQEYEAAWPEALAAAKDSVAAEHEEVVAAGGLYVLGTERHESRRIDNQLRGRSGRQGDPGESRFYLSLEDELMRRFNSQLTERVMSMTGFPEDLPLESKLVTRGIQSAQTQVEATNFEIRKNVLKYDDVMNRQRTVVYDVRRAILHGEDLEDRIQGFLDDVVVGLVQTTVAGEIPEEWDLDQLWIQLKNIFPVSITPEDLVAEAGSRRAVTGPMLERELLADIHLAYRVREDAIGHDAMRELERRVLLAVLDRKWREHLYEMDYLKEGIGLRAMAQRDPLVEYQREGYQMFQAMDEAIKEEVVGYLFNLEVKVEENQAEDSTAEPTVSVTATATPAPSRPKVLAKGLEAPAAPAQALQYSAPDVDGGAEPVQRAASGTNQSTAELYPGTGRNQPCPCGSGKKYKMCHGRGQD